VARLRPRGAPGRRESPTIGLDYGNHRDVWPENSLVAQGTWHVPQAFEAAVVRQARPLGLFFSNLAKDSRSRCTSTSTARALGPDLRGRACARRRDGEKIIGKVGKDNHVRFTIELAPRQDVCVAVLRARKRR